MHAWCRHKQFNMTSLCTHCMSHAAHTSLPGGIWSQPCVIKGHSGAAHFASLSHHCMRLASIQASTHSSKLKVLSSLYFADPQYPVTYTMKVVPAKSREAKILRAVGCSLPPLQGAQLLLTVIARMVLNSQLLPFISLLQDQYLVMLHETVLLLWQEISTFWFRCLPCFDVWAIQSEHSWGIMIPPLPKCITRMDNHSPNPSKAIWFRQKRSAEMTALLLCDNNRDHACLMQQVLAGEAEALCPLLQGTWI